MVLLWRRWSSSPIILLKIVIVVILMVKRGHTRGMWAPIRGVKTRQLVIILSWRWRRSSVSVFKMHMVLRGLAMKDPGSHARWKTMRLALMMESHAVFLFLSCHPGIMCLSLPVLVLDVESFLYFPLNALALLALHDSVLELLATKGPGMLKVIIVVLGVTRRPV